MGECILSWNTSFCASERSVFSQCKRSANEHYLELSCCLLLIALNYKINQFASTLCAPPNPSTSSLSHDSLNYFPIGQRRLKTKWLQTLLVGLTSFWPLCDFNGTQWQSSSYPWVWRSPVLVEGERMMKIFSEAAMHGHLNYGANVALPLSAKWHWVSVRHRCCCH